LSDLKMELTAGVCLDWDVVSSELQSFINYYYCCCCWWLASWLHL